MVTLFITPSYLPIFNQFPDTKEIANQHGANDLAVIESRHPLTFEEENMEPDGKHYYIYQKFALFNSDGVTYAVG